MSLCNKLSYVTNLGLIAIALFVPCNSFASSINISFGGTTVLNEGIISSIPGVTNVNFDGGLTPGYYTLGSTAQIAQGNSSGVYATPTGDTSNYLSTGNSSITITPSSAYNYFGLYWGSLDDYNSISFKEANGTSVSYTGGQIAGFAGIPTDGATSVYVNFALTGTTFSSITLSSGQYAFESDNHAFGNIAAAPEPATWALLAGGIGLTLLGKLRRKQQR